MITWDEIKRQSNIAKHKIDFAVFTEDFFSNAMVRPAKHGRYTATGELSELIVTVVFRPIGAEAIALISARPASRRERLGR